MPDLNPRLTDAVLALCRQVGETQQAAFRRARPGSGEHKPDGSLSVALERDSEERLRSGLAALLPEAGFLGEESGRTGREDLLWVVDPLDGTTNFLAGLEPFAISVALVRDGIAELGVVYGPSRGECFTALRGSGAQHNGRPLPVATCLTLAQAVVGIGLPAAPADGSRAALLARLDRLWEQARDLRCLGCAAFELSHVAAGHLQGFWEVGLKAWDIAAASVLLAETGCRIADAHGEPYRLFESSGIVVGHPGVFEALLDIVADAG